MSYTAFGLLESGHWCNTANRKLGTNRFYTNAPPIYSNEWSINLQ